MNKDYSSLTNEELITELKNSIKETNSILKEIEGREKKGTLKRKYDAIDKYIFEKYSTKKGIQTIQERLLIIARK